MRKYKYRAMSGNGKIVSGELDAADYKDACNKLRAMSLVPVSAERADSAGASEPSKSSESDASKINLGGEKTSLAFFKKLLQLCGGGGMPVSDALKSLAQRSLDARTKVLCRELYKELSEGRTLSDALKKYPALFDPCITHLVEAGETTANLGFVFENIISYIEARRQLRRTIISALAYPVFLCVMASGVVLLFLFFMLPRIESMMSNIGAGENGPIVLMKTIGSVLTTGVPIAATLVVIAFIAVKLVRKTPEGLLKTDAFLLKIPVIGKIASDSDLCRFSTLASTLFASGVNTTETFRLAEKSVKNSLMRSRIQSFRVAVNDGAPISAALKKFGIIDEEDIDIVSVGERTGSLVSAFAEIGKSHSESLNRRIKLSTGALGGVALALAFALVLIFAVGIVLSILGISHGLISK